MRRRSFSPPTRKRWRWLLLIAAAVVLVAILPALFLALWGPSLLGRLLSAYLHTAVTVQGVTGGWWSGISIHHLTVAEDPAPQAPTLVRVDNLTVNLPLVSILLSTKPIIVLLDTVHIELRQRQDGQWNLMPFVKALGSSPSAGSQPRGIVPWLNRQLQVTVAHGTLRVGEEAELTDLAIGLSWAAGRLTITQAEASIAGSTVALRGEMSLQEPAADIALQWQVAGLRLGRLLGPAFQPVTIAEATGRLSQQGDALMLETSVQVPTFALAPGTLGRRQPQLTRLDLTCTLQLVSPFTRLAMEACRLHAAEAQLSLQGSAIDFGAEPRLALQVNGSLAGTLVGALVPEVPGHFPDSVRVGGQITVPFAAPVWPAMGWRLAVSGARFVFEDALTSTEVHTTVVKSGDRLEIADLRASRGTGEIHGTGGWRLTEPVDGGLQVELDRISLRQSLAEDAAGGPYLVEGTVSGAVAWRTGHDGEHITVDARVHPLRLRHTAATIFEMPEGHMHGRLGRDPDGTWWGDELAFQSADLTVTLYQGKVRLSPAEAARFEGHATMRSEGPWLTPLLAIAGVGGLVLSGQNEVTLQATGHPDHPLETLEGKGSVLAAAGTFYDQAFSGVDVTYEVSSGRLHIPQGVVTFEAGTAAVHGSLGMPWPFSARDDEIAIRLHQVPVHFAGQEPAALSTTTELNGEVTARGMDSGGVRLGLDLQVLKMTRPMGQDGQMLAGVELPALHITSEVLTAPPWAQWHASAVRVQADGLAVELRDVAAQRTPTHYDLAGAVDLQASTEVVTGLVASSLPEWLQVSGPFELAGSVAGQIPVDGRIALRDLTYAGNLRVSQVVWDGTVWQAVAARLTVAQGRLTVDDARARVLGGWMWLRPETFVDLQGPRRDFHLHLAAEQLDLRLETGKRLQLLALVIPLFLLEPNRQEPIRMSGMFDAEMQASGRYDGQPGWSQSVNGTGYFRIAQGAVLGSTLISGFVTKALTLPANLVDQSLKALLDRGGEPFQVIGDLLQRPYDFGILNSPIELRAGEIHLADNLTVSAPEFSLVINGYSTLEGAVDYDVHTDLVHRALFGEATNLADEIPLFGPVLRHVNPFQLMHRHLELSATVQGNLFRHNATGQPDVHLDIHFIQ